MSREVYITALSSYLPGAPVENDEMEGLLGLVGGQPSRARQRVLRRNGIKKRHYVIDPQSGALRWNNAQLTAEAVRKLYPNADAMRSIDTLACGTSVPDQVLPSHAVMVHAELGIPPCEVVATSGVCASSVAAMKYARMAVASGASEHAVATGSELASTLMRANMFEKESAAKVRALESNPTIALDREFLRWMLSDGAGAVRLGAVPLEGATNLRLDWIDILSYASETETCMYAGADKQPDGRLKGWREYDDLHAMIDQSVLSIKQDVKVLNQYLGVTISKGLAEVRRRHDLSPDAVQWFLPHLSSEYFREALRDAMVAVEFDVAPPRWFTNLAERGNTGAASVYIMLDELVRSGRPRPGERLLCFVPESGRFTSAWIHLTVV